MKTRSTLGRGATLATLAVSVVALVGTPGAVATQGQPVIAGVVNEETSSTSFCRSHSTFPCASYASGAVTAETNEPNGDAVGAYSASGTGVWGSGLRAGVEGVASAGGTGVYGHHAGTTGIGVWGETAGVGSAVYGLATANGVGLNGDSGTGIGVRAKSSSGKALEVLGKATFSRSGFVTIAEGATSKAVTLAGVTTASMILATAQQNTAISVKAAVATAGKFTVYLTGNAPAGGLKVAYFVMN